MRQSNNETKRTPCRQDELVRLPGLFPRWEIEHILDEETEFTIEATSEMSDGEPLYVVYRRELPTTR